MRKKLYIFSGLVVVLLVAVYFLMLPRRSRGCVLGKAGVTLSTVQTGKFVELIPFTANTVDSTSSKVIAQLDQMYFKRVSPGLTASAWFNDNEYFFTVVQKDSVTKDQRFQVTLSSVDSTFRNIKRTTNLRMRLIVSEAENALMLHVGGFYKDTGGKYVYVVLPNEKVVKRNIVLGRTNPEHFEVLSGLVAGDVVITSSYENFNDEDDLDLTTVRDLVE